MIRRIAARSGGGGSLRRAAIVVAAAATLAAPCTRAGDADRWQVASDPPAPR